MLLFQQKQQFFRKQHFSLSSCLCFSLSLCLSLSQVSASLAFSLIYGKWNFRSDHKKMLAPITLNQTQQNESTATSTVSPPDWTCICWWFGIISNVALSLRFFNPFHTSSPFLYPWKKQKTFGFRTFSGGIEMEHWPDTG